MNQCPQGYTLTGGVCVLGGAGPPGPVTTPFTPQLVFGGSTAGITYGTQYGSSTVDGNLVTIVVNLVLTSKGTATGSAFIQGLPVSPAAYGAAAAMYYNMSGVISILAQAAAANNVVYLYNAAAPAAFPANLTDVNFTNTSLIQFTITYPLA